MGNDVLCHFHTSCAIAVSQWHSTVLELSHVDRHRQLADVGSLVGAPIGEARDCGGVQARVRDRPLSAPARGRPALRTLHAY
jgi:hypothetical protein